MSAAIFGCRCQCNLSHLNMTATIKKVLLSYCCIHYSKMSSMLITIMSKRNTNPRQKHRHYFSGWS